jgi:hypothetical protein
MSAVCPREFARRCKTMPRVENEKSRQSTSLLVKRYGLATLSRWRHGFEPRWGWGCKEFLGAVAKRVGKGHLAELCGARDCEA